MAIKLEQNVRCDTEGFGLQEISNATGVKSERWSPKENFVDDYQMMTNSKSQKSIKQ